MEFPRLIRKWSERTRHRGGGFKMVVCEEREYAEDDPRGQYQLWMDGEYAWDITRQYLQRRKDHTPMSWLGAEGHGTNKAHVGGDRVTQGHEGIDGHLAEMKKLVESM